MEYRVAKSWAVSMVGGVVVSRYADVQEIMNTLNSLVSQGLFKVSRLGDMDVYTWA